MYKAELFIKENATLGEGPFWDIEEKELMWIDIEEKKIYFHDIKGNEKQMILLDQMVGAVVKCTDGKYLGAMENGFYFLDRNNNTVTSIIDPEKERTDNRFNDGKCDPAGRFIAGTMSLEHKSNQGSLYSLNRDLDHTRLITGVTTSNGLAWNKDGSIMYYIDTPTQTVVSYSYELETGNISNKKIIIDFSTEKGSPDGMTIDSEGMLWIAHWGGFKVTRWDPIKGKKIDSIELPAEKITSCVFGGEDLSTLYITSASIGTDMKQTPLAGCVFSVKTDTVGTLSEKFIVK